MMYFANCLFELKDHTGTSFCCHCLKSLALFFAVLICSYQPCEIMGGAGRLSVWLEPARANTNWVKHCILTLERQPDNPKPL